MLGDQIKKYRKEKKMSQEELAIPLNVVRQTVSKWENNLSVPDAELLIRLAEVLEISVAELLGTDEQPRSESLSAETLAIELARLNEELAKQVQERSLSSRAEQKRNLILFFSMLSMLFALIIDNTIVSVLLTFACLLTAVIILWKVLHLWGWHHPFFIQLPGHLEAYLRHSISLRQNYTECRSMVRWSRHLRQQSCWRRASEADLYWQGCLAADGSSAISIHFPGRIWKSCFLIFILHRSLSCKI